MSLELSEKVKLVTQDTFNAGPPFYISGNNLVGAVMYETIVCKTYPSLPQKSKTICKKVKTLYENTFEKITKTYYLQCFKSYKDLYEYLYDNLLAIPEIEELNLSENEYKAGLDVHDGSRAAFCTGTPKNEKDDFVDLDAFVRSVCHGLIRQCQAIDFSTFNERR